LRTGADVLRGATSLLSALFIAGLVVWGFWPWLPFGKDAAPPRTVIFYGFSILAETFDKSVFPEFSRRWQQETGEKVEFITSFAGSGTVTNQVIMGVPAELVLLSLEPDADRLAAAGVVPEKSWRSLPHEGVVNRTPFIIFVRPGNPKQIKDFADLARPGIKVVHPDPLTSGGANWAILAEYGAGLRENGPEAGFQLLTGIWKNVAAQAASARAARTQFENGFGDALITYEQEAIADRARGRLKADVVYPKRTILSEHTLVVVDKNVREGNRRVIDALVEFLWSEPAQKLFVASGFRSVDPAVGGERPDFGKIEDPFLVGDLGGWKEAKRAIVEDLWKKRVLPELGR
jgi:sulfate/thiosulfate transport system substrate-binding protein